MNLYLDSIANILAVVDDDGVTHQTSPKTYKDDLPSDLAEKVGRQLRGYPSGWLVVGEPDAFAS